MFNKCNKLCPLSHLVRKQYRFYLHFKNEYCDVTKLRLLKNEFYLSNTLEGLEGLLDGEQGLDRPDHHHDDHHYWEDGDGVAAHVHDEEVHGDLLKGAEGHVPAPLDPQVGICLSVSSTICRTFAYLCFSICPSCLII